MIDRIDETPPISTPSLSTVREDLDRLRRAANERRWKEFVHQLKDATASLQRATRTVESSWAELSEDDQDLFLHVKELFDTIVSSGPQPHPNIAERVVAQVSGSDDEEKRLVWQFAIAVGSFMTALQQVLRREQRTRAFVDSSMTADPEATATIERGVSEYRAGLGKVYSLEEFQSRFNLS
jgi:Zn-dependent oligopeptidase